MTREQLNEEKKRLEAELEANAKQRKNLKTRLAAVETLLVSCDLRGPMEQEKA